MAVGGGRRGFGEGWAHRPLAIYPADTKRRTAVKKRGNPAGAMSAVLAARAPLAAKRRQRRCCGCEEQGILYLWNLPSPSFALDSWYVAPSLGLYKQNGRPFPATPHGTLVARLNRRRFCGEFRRHGRYPPTLRGRPYQTGRPEPIRNGPGCGFVIRKMRCVAPDPGRPARSTAL
ncbi:hypothetical protein MTO96_010798 [Rhipicephalus appendiculatus]